MNVKIYMRNSFQEETLMRMLAWMEFCGNVGHYTEFVVGFDGDGDAMIHCDFETEELQKKYSAIRKEIRDSYNNCNEDNEDPESFGFGV